MIVCFARALNSDDDSYLRANTGSSSSSPPLRPLASTTCSHSTSSWSSTFTRTSHRARFTGEIQGLGFRFIGLRIDFKVEHFYQDQPQSEIHSRDPTIWQENFRLFIHSPNSNPRLEKLFNFAVAKRIKFKHCACVSFLHEFHPRRVLKAFTVFPTYNRQLAESDSEAISPELFAEFIAYLLEIKEEPRLRKVIFDTQSHLDHVALLVRHHHRNHWHGTTHTTYTLNVTTLPTRSTTTLLHYYTATVHYIHYTTQV